MKIATALLSLLVASVLLGSEAAPTEIPRISHLNESSDNVTFTSRQGNAFCVPKVSLKFSKTTARGGTGGTNFDDLSSLRYDEELKAIEIRSAARIDKISFTTKYSTYEHGGNGGTVSKLTLRPTDKITRIKTCVGTHNGSLRVFFLSFTLHNGNTFNNGQTTSTCYTTNVPSDKVVVAGHGRAASELDRLGFVLRTPMC